MLNDGCDKVLKGEFKRLRLEVRHVAIVDKKNWTLSMVHKISDMKKSLKTTWDDVELLEKGCAKNHDQIKPLKLRKK